MVECEYEKSEKLEVVYCVGRENGMETTTLQRLKVAGWKCGRKIDISAFKKKFFLKNLDFSILKI